MMYKKKIFLGYLKGLVKGRDITCDIDSILTSNDDYGVMYVEHLPVLFDNKEFLKTVNPQYIFKNHTIEEVQKKVKGKFPITIEKFESLSKELRHSIRWTKYGVK